MQNEWTERIKELEAELAEKDTILKEVEEEAEKVRFVLILNHGHKGQYFDDGEMQCSECGFGNYDFKAPSLSEITKRIVFSLNHQLSEKEREIADWKREYRLINAAQLKGEEQIAALKAEREAMKG